MGQPLRNASGLNLKEAVSPPKESELRQLARISNPAMLAYHISMIENTSGSETNVG